jgi:hypothetical protein
MSAATAMTAAAAIALIEAAKGPRDIFGDAPDDERDPGAGRPHAIYRRLARLIHPDAAARDHRATSAFQKLSALWQQYRAGDAGLLAAGDIANLLPATAPQPTEPALLKLARDPADGDLMKRETLALRWLAAAGDPQFRPYVPKIFGTRRYDDRATGGIRRGNVLQRLDGFISLEAIARRFPAGLDPRDVAWIWRRALVAIGFAHRAGLVHGAVLPPHLMIEPDEHGLTLVDWCYSSGGPNPGNLPAAVASYRDWYPPELRPGYAPGPDLDIYLATKTMRALIAAPVPGPLAAFAAGCTLASRDRRPADAWELLREFDELIERMWGPRTFRPFPGIDP